MFAFVQWGVADSWDTGNYKPYNTEVILEKTNLPIIFIDTREPFSLACVSAYMVESGISWVLKLTRVPSMSKNNA